MFGFSALHRVQEDFVFYVECCLPSSHRPHLPMTCRTANQPLPIDRGMMQRLSNFTLNDVTNGRSLMLYGFQGRKAIVLVFLGNDCPVGKSLRAAAHRDQSRVLQEGRRDSRASIPTPTKPRPTSPSSSRSGASISRSSKIPRTWSPTRPWSSEPVRSSSWTASRESSTAARSTTSTSRARARTRPTITIFAMRSASLVSGGKISTRATTVAGCLIDRVAGQAARSVARRPRSEGPRPRSSQALDAKEKEHPVEVGKVSYSGEVAAILAEQVPDLPPPGPGRRRSHY